MQKFPSLSSPVTPIRGKRRQLIKIEKLTPQISPNQSFSDEEDLKNQAKAAEIRYGSSPGQVDFYTALKSSFNDQYSYFNPSLEKNLSRLYLPLPSPPHRQSSPKTPASPQSPKPLFRILDRPRFDALYQHSSASLATNPLPLPGSPVFDQLVKSKKSRLKVISATDIIEKIEAEKRFLMNILPKEENQYVEIDPDKAISQVPLLTFYWSLRVSTGSKPESREGGTMVVMDRKFYLYGGQSMVKRNDTRMFNPDTGVWTMISTLYDPKGRVGHTMCPFKGQLVLYGGWSHYSQRLRLRRCFKKVHVLTFGEENKWQGYSCSGCVPKSRRDHAMSHIGSSMLIFGGVDGHSHTLKSSRILNLTTLEWRKLPLKPSISKPKRRSGASFTAAFPQMLACRFDISVDQLLLGKPDISLYPYSGFYLFGGLGDDNLPLNDIWHLKFASSHLIWVELQPTGRAPIPRHSHSCTYLNQMLLVYGGRNDMNTHASNGSLGDVIVLRLENVHWEHVNIVGTVPSNRWGHAAVGLGTKLYILGGLNYANFQPADLMVLETEQGLAAEYVKLEEEREERRKDKRKRTVLFP